jgi:hypothetical protein
MGKAFVRALGLKEAYVDQDFFDKAYNDSEQIWKELLVKSGLTVFDTLTHGGSHMSSSSTSTMAPKPFLSPVVFFDSGCKP